MQRRESGSAGIVNADGTIRNFLRASAQIRKSTMRSTASVFYSGIVSAVPIRHLGRRSMNTTRSGMQRTEKNKMPSGALTIKNTKRKKKHAAASGTRRIGTKYVRGSANGMRGARSRKQGKHEAIGNMQRRLLPLPVSGLYATEQHAFQP